MERTAKKSTVRSSKDRRARRRSRKNNQERVTNWSVARSVTNSRWPQGRERNEGGNKGSEKSGRCSAIVRVETSSEVGGAPRKLATEKDNKEGMVQCVSELSEASRGEQRRAEARTRVRGRLEHEEGSSMLPFASSRYARRICKRIVTVTNEKE